MRHIKGHIITVFPLFLVLILLPSYIPIVNLAQASSDSITLEKYTDPLPEGPTLNDANLNLEEISTGLDLPTGMTFVGPNDILVTEKNTGIVKRITNGQLNPEPVLDVSIANVKEREEC